MPVLSGPVWTAAALLVWAATSKLKDPAPTAGGLRSLGWPSSPWLVRVLAMTETAIGVTVLAVGGLVPTAALAVAYLGFSWFVAIALRRGGSYSSCGCFGTPDVPVTPLHLVVDLSLATLVLAALGSGTVPSLPAALAADPSAALTLAAFAGVATYLVRAVMEVLPTLRPSPS